VGFIRKLPHTLVESFKSTLDEVRESDILLHVVDISHSGFEEQIRIVNETLSEIGAIDKPTYIVFNKTDAFRYSPKDEDDLGPTGAENISLEDLKRTWMARSNGQCVFISARKLDNISEMKDLLYYRVKEIHAKRYPYNDYLY
jgi:GTP-binding protein HflX